MKNKPDTFVTSNTPDTIADDGAYSISATQIDSRLIERFAQKHDVSHIREIFELKYSVVDSKLEKIQDSLKGMETKFWTINGIIIASIIAIFLFALPNLYKHDYSEKYSAVTESISKIHIKMENFEKQINYILETIKPSTKE